MYVYYVPPLSSFQMKLGKVISKYCSILFNLDRGVTCDHYVQFFDFGHLLN
jgi:hypothetical protein